MALLQESNTTLHKSGSEFEGQQPLLKRSLALLRNLKSQEFWDHYVLYGGLMVFLGVCGWVVYKRLAYFVPEVAKDVIRSGTGKAYEVRSFSLFFFFFCF